MRKLCLFLLTGSCWRTLVSLLVFGSMLGEAGAEMATNQVVQTGPETFRIGAIDLNRKERTLRFPAEVRITNEVVEYALVTRDGKTHESVLTTEVSPTHLHVAVLLLGITPAPDLGLTNAPIRLQKNSTARIDVTWKPVGKKKEQRARLGDLISLQPSIGNSVPARRRFGVDRWSYTGSFLHEGLFLAQEEGSIVSLIRDPVALLNNPAIDRDNDDIHFANPHRLPPKGTPVTLEIRF